MRQPFLLKLVSVNDLSKVSSILEVVSKAAEQSKPAFITFQL